MRVIPSIISGRIPPENRGDVITGYNKSGGFQRESQTPPPMGRRRVSMKEDLT